MPIADAPWCGHCKALAPEFAAAATELRAQGSNIYLGKMDATQEPMLAEKYEVRGYPTLKFFIKGSPIEYNGGRSAEQLKNWLLKKTGPPATTLASAEDAQKFIDEVEVAVVGFFQDQESEAAKAYLDAAMELDDFAFGVVSDKAVFDALEVASDGVMLFKKFDERRNHLELAEVTKEAVKKHITTNSLPLVVEFSHQTAQKIFGGEVKAHNLLFLSKQAPESAATIEGFRKVAQEFKNKVLFVTIDTDVEDHERIMEFFGLKKAEVPEMRLIKLEEEMTKFKPPTKDLDQETIQKFVQGVLDGSIKVGIASVFSVFECNYAFLQKQNFLFLLSKKTNSNICCRRSCPRTGTSRRSRCSSRPTSTALRWTPPRTCWSSSVSASSACIRLQLPD